MSKDQGMSFLVEKQRLIEAEQWRRRFWEDLTDQTEFPWSYLVAGLRGGQEVLQAGVDQFALCWVGGEWKRPAFYIREACGRESVLLLTTRAVWNAPRRSPTSIGVEARRRGAPCCIAGGNVSRIVSPCCIAEGTPIALWFLLYRNGDLRLHRWGSQTLRLPRH